MRKNIVAGNWKMNTTLQEGVALAKGVNEALKNVNANCDVVIGVPFTHLAPVNDVIDSSKLGLAAENCADHKSGAYTGEVSAPMVASTGAKYVILGHSERRQYYGETSEILKTKVNLALENGLAPIFCIGEVLEERENGSYFEVVKSQIVEALFELSAEDLKELQEVFHLFIFDILGMKDEAASAGGNNYEAFGKAIDLLLSIRQQAKANKDWATSDKIRNELTAFGFEIKDTKDGAEWKLSK